MAEEKLLSLEEQKALQDENAELKQVNEDLLAKIEELEKKPAAVKWPTFTHDKQKYEVRNTGWYEPSLAKTITAEDAVKDKELCADLVKRSVGFIVPLKNSK